MNKLQPTLRFTGFSGDWSSGSISSVANKITDGTHDTPKPIEEGYPYLTAIHVKNGKIEYNKCYYLSKEDHDKIYRRCNPEKNDLLMVNIGAGTANTALIEVDYEFSLKNVALIKPNKEIIDPAFLAQVQINNSSRLFNQITSGGAQPFLSLNEIGKLKLNYPTLSEQQKIASFLTAIDKKIEQLQKKKELLEQYKKGMMQKLFSREIRFKDDNGKDFSEWEYEELGNLLKYEQPTKYIVNSTDYDDSFDIPVLTAGKSFILGYTDELNNIYTSLPVIIFDDFTRANKWVNFPFKVKSSAMKILSAANDTVNIKYVFETMQMINISESDEHKRCWISEHSKIEIPFPAFAEQTKIADFLTAIDDKIALTNKELEGAKTFKKGLLQQMFV